MGVRHVRWLLPPILSAIAEWSLLICPEVLLSVCPVFWATSVLDEDDAFLLHLDILRFAGFASVIFVLIAYHLLLLVLASLVLPAFLADPMSQCKRKFWEVIVRVASILCPGWALELVMYAAAIVINIQTFRAAKGITGSARLQGPWGGIVLVLCWVVSLRSHARGESKSLMLFMSSAYATAVFIPVAALYECRGSSFIAVSALHATASFAAAASGLLSPGLSYREHGVRCGAVASAIVFLVATASQHKLGDVVQLRHMSASATFLGRIAYFMIMLVLSCKWVADPKEYWSLQGVVVVSLAIVHLAGMACKLPALTSTAYTFMLFWFAIKECELTRESIGLKLMAVYILYQFLSRDVLLSTLDFQTTPASS